jgi:Fe-S cluster assembly protein SufD
VRNNLNSLINGDNCEANFKGLYFLNNNEFADNHTLADHSSPNSNSNEIYRGIINDSATAVFNGKILVRPDAQKTNAYQSNKNILLSDEATINTKPQLEIFADDVKCSHGATSGTIDEESLFYLRARGISEDLARSLLLSAFAYDLISEIIIPELKNKIKNQIAKRLNITEFAFEEN